MKPLRILQVVPRLNGGGVEEEVVLIAQLLVHKGHGAVVVTQEGRLVPSLQKLGVTVDLLNVASKNPLTLLLNAWRLKKRVRTHHIDLMHVHSRAPAWSVALAARMAGIPWVSTYHSAYGGQRWLKRLYNSIMARGHRVVTISTFIHSHVHKVYGACSWFDSRKIRHISRGIDTNFFNLETLLDPDGERLLRRTYQIPPHSPVILMPGRFTALKGQGLLLKAFSLLRQQGHEAVLLFVGSTDQSLGMHQTLAKGAHLYGVAHAVRFAPFTKDLRPFYGLATCVVVPSVVPEGFGRVIAEAMAWRRIVIASRHGGALELIQDSVTGRLVTPRAPHHLATVLGEVLSMPKAQREAMGTRARTYIQENFSLPQFAQNTLDLYIQCLAEWSCKKKPQQTSPLLEKH